MSNEMFHAQSRISITDVRDLCNSISRGHGGNEKKRIEALKAVGFKFEKPACVGRVGHKIMTNVGYSAAYVHKQSIVLQLGDDTSCRKPKPAALDAFSIAKEKKM